MRLVLISDTHCCHDELEMPEGDILVHAGDMTSTGTVNQLVQVNRWFGSLKSRYSHIVCIAGNHDWLFERDPALAKTIMSNATYLQDSGCTAGGLKFWGSPRTPRFFDWAFNHDRGEDIKRFWDLIPEGIDVLVTHGPPYGIGDITTRAGHVGCQDLLGAVRRVKPKLHVFGHIHTDPGVSESLGTKFVNAACLNDFYRPESQPVIVEV